MLTTSQAAKTLGVTPAQVRWYCRRRYLPATRLGRDWLIDEKDLRSFARPPMGRPKALP